MIMEYTGDYSRRAEVHWLHTFLDKTVSDLYQFETLQITFTGDDIKQNRYIFDLNGLQEFIEQSVRTYYEIESLENIEEYELQ